MVAGILGADLGEIGVYPGHVKGYGGSLHRYGRTKYDGKKYYGKPKYGFKGGYSKGYVVPRYAPGRGVDVYGGPFYGGGGPRYTDTVPYSGGVYLESDRYPGSYLPYDGARYNDGGSGKKFSPLPSHKKIHYGDGHAPNRFGKGRGYIQL